MKKIFLLLVFLLLMSSVGLGSWEGEAYFSYPTFTFGFAEDDNNIYVSYDHYINITSKYSWDGVLVIDIPDGDRLVELYKDNDYLYAGSRDNYKVYVFNEVGNVWNNVTTLDNFSNEVVSLYADDNFLYGGAIDGGEDLYVYYKSNWTVMNSFDYDAGGVYEVYADDEYVYFGTRDDNLYILYKDNFTNATTISAWGYVQGISSDEDYIYYGFSDGGDPSFNSWFFVINRTDWSNVTSWNGVNDADRDIFSFVNYGDYVYSSTLVKNKNTWENKTIVFQIGSDYYDMKASEFYVYTPVSNRLVINKSTNIQSFESYDDQIFYNSLTTYYINITSLYKGKYDNTSINAYINIDGFNYTATNNGIKDNKLLFSYDYTPSNETPQNITHYWTILYQDVNNYLNRSHTTEYFNQTLLYPNVSICNTENTYAILNTSWIDELTNNPLLADETHEWYFNDGNIITKIEGNFTNSYDGQYCTNINPEDTTYNWNLYGTLILSKEDYVTRIFSYNSLTPLLVSNKPSTNISFPLIELNSSSTITYTWYTTGYQLIDGTLKIYSCDTDNKRTLTESTPITNGEATANIVLITQPYSYSVEIGSVTYNQTEFYQCHTEEDTTATYYVDTIDNTINELLGLFLNDCTLENSGENTVSMSWGANIQDEQEIQACIISYNKNNKEFSRTCSNSSTYSFTTAIPASTIYAKGELTQGGSIVYCPDTLIFESERTNVFGYMGIFGAILLIISLALLLSDKGGEVSIIGAIIGILLSWIIGILSIGWIGASSIIAFLIIIIMVGRYSRKRD